MSTKRRLQRKLGVGPVAHVRPFVDDDGNAIVLLVVANGAMKIFPCEDDETAEQALAFAVSHGADTVVWEPPISVGAVPTGMTWDDLATELEAQVKAEGMDFIREPLVSRRN